jgi:acetamidase/formamidase
VRAFFASLLSLNVEAYRGVFNMAIRIQALTVLPQHASFAQMKCTHTIHDHSCHFGWNNANTPVVRIKPGETIEFHTQDSSAGQLGPTSTLADLNALDFNKVNPVTGPVYIDGAEPGDAIKVTLLEFGPSGWGWTANIPGFGLLADQFKDPALHIWSYDAAALTPALFGPGGRVPLKPFCGTIGLAPAEPGQHSIVPPRRVGGNLDIRDLAKGAELYLPVEVAGGVFSLGDTHAAQGDGEVCGTAIESPCTVAAKFELVKAANLSFPRFTTPGPVTRHLDVKGYEVTTGIGPDLMQNARDAVSGMIDLLSRRYKMNPVDAYMLCSVCGDLRISEIVDVPNWVVSFYFPRVVLE